MQAKYLNQNSMFLWNIEFNLHGVYYSTNKGKLNPS